MSLTKNKETPKEEKKPQQEEYKPKRKSIIAHVNELEAEEELKDFLNKHE